MNFVPSLLIDIFHLSQNTCLSRDKKRKTKTINKKIQKFALELIDFLLRIIKYIFKITNLVDFLFFYPKNRLKFLKFVLIFIIL